MKNGFYSLFQAGGDEDPLDEDAWGLAMLIHLKDGRVVGVDQGGCKISGHYAEQPDGTIHMPMIYEMRCGSPLPDGSVLADSMTLERTLSLGADAQAGAHQRVDIGLGPMFIRFEWLAGSD